MANGAAACGRGGGAGALSPLPPSMSDAREPHALAFGGVTRARETRVPSRDACEMIHTGQSVRVRVMTCR